MTIRSHDAIVACIAAFEAGLILHASDEDGAEHTAGRTCLPDGESGWAIYTYRRGPAEDDTAFNSAAHLARNFVQYTVGKTRALDAARRAFEKAGHGYT